MKVTGPLFAALVLLRGVVSVQAQELQDLRIGIIDFYGLRRQSAPVRWDRRSWKRCFAISGGPRGQARLAEDVVQAGDDLGKVGVQAILRGDSGEDHSQGHALMHDPASRAIQERFIAYAARDLKRLRDVLRHSNDADHRALAAQVLGYAADKRAVVADLVYGMGDPAEEVRNNSMRALWIIAKFAAQSPNLKIRVPTKPFIGLLNSPTWSDLNKTSLALMELSTNRAPILLASIREQAIRPLVEMARWKSEGHAMPALMILGRIAGWSDGDVESALTRGEREAVIDAALMRR